MDCGVCKATRVLVPGFPWPPTAVGTHDNSEMLSPLVTKNKPSDRPSDVPALGHVGSPRDPTGPVFALPNPQVGGNAFSVYGAGLSDERNPTSAQVLFTSFEKTIAWPRFI